MSATVPFPRRPAAEALGTGRLVLVGTGCVMTNVLAQGALGLAEIALTWGFLVTALIAMLGGISGAHFNPAVTIALVVTGKRPLTEAVRYVVAQCAGATLASLVLLSTLGSVSNLGATLPTVAHGAALAIQFWLSFVLMATVLGSTSDERRGGGGAAIAIGMAVALDVLMVGPPTGASMNPARSLGPASIGGRWEAHWIDRTAPIAGMCSAAVVLRWLHGR
ncbi:MAG: aquaporin [Gemmatimonadota bacterium]